MKNKAQLIAAIAAGLGLASAASAQTSLYLNPTQATANNGLSTISSWWTDAAGTTANAAAVSNAANQLTFNNLVTSSSGFSGRTGGGSGGTISIYGFKLLDPAGPITVTAGTQSGGVGTPQTVTLNGAVSIDMSAATQDFTFKAGSVLGSATLRLSSAIAVHTWKIGTGRTFTMGDLSNGTTTSLAAQTTGRTLNINGDGTTAMGSVVFNGNVGSNNLAIAIDGTGTSSSGGSVAFNGVTNALGSLSITNATATFASGGTTSGTVTVNSGGVLSGLGTFSGAVTVNGGLRPNALPVNDTSRLSFTSSLTLAGTSVTTFDFDGANFTGVSVTGASSLGGGLNFSFTGSALDGTYDLFNFGTAPTGSFASVNVTSIGALTFSSGIWSGTFGGKSYEFTESTGDLVISAVPEPSSFAALAGLVGLGFAASRRRRSA